MNINLFEHNNFNNDEINNNKNNDKAENNNKKETIISTNINPSKIQNKVHSNDSLKSKNIKTKQKDKHSNLPIRFDKQGTPIYSLTTPSTNEDLEENQHANKQKEKDNFSKFNLNNQKIQETQSIDSVDNEEDEIKLDNDIENEQVNASHKVKDFILSKDGKYKLINQGAIKSIWKPLKGKLNKVCYTAHGDFFTFTKHENELKEEYEKMCKIKQKVLQSSGSIEHLAVEATLIDKDDQKINNLFTIEVDEALGDLKSIIEPKKGKKSTLTPKDSIKLGVDLLDGLNNLHLSSYVLGDGKPDNCLIYPGKDQLTLKLKLSDFGKAQQIKNSSLNEEEEEYKGINNNIKSIKLNDIDLDSTALKEDDFNLNFNKSNKTNIDLQSNVSVINNGIDIDDIDDYKKISQNDKKAEKSIPYKGNTRYGNPEQQTSLEGDIYSFGLVLIRILEEPFLQAQNELTLKEVKDKDKDFEADKSLRGIERYAVESKKFRAACNPGKSPASLMRRQLTKNGLNEEQIEGQTKALCAYIDELEKRLVQSNIFEDKNQNEVYTNIRGLCNLIKSMTASNPQDRPNAKMAYFRYQYFANQLL